MGECLIIRGGGGTDTSNANATAGKVLSGYTCYVNDSKITGTMPNQGTKTASLNPGGSYTIQAGYHNGSGKISVNSLSSQTSATANAGRILSGRTAWVGGSKLTGTMTNRGAVSKALGANGSYTIPAGWHNGSGKVTQNLTKQAAVNVTPGTANKTACAANRWTTGNIVIVGSSSLTAGNIKNGVWIFGVKGTFRGWVDSDYVLIDNGNLTSGVTFSFCSWSTNNPSGTSIDPTPYRDSSKNNWINISDAGTNRCAAIYLPNCSGRTPKSNEITIEFWVEFTLFRTQNIQMFFPNNTSHNGWHWASERIYDWAKLSAYESDEMTLVTAGQSDGLRTFTFGGSTRTSGGGTWCGWIYLTYSVNSGADVWIRKLWVNWN